MSSSSLPAPETWGGLSAATRLFGLLGDPVAHSLSPAIHNAALQAAGIDGVYLALRVSPLDLGMAIAGARALGIAGLNVTIPHKVSVIAHLDGVTPVAGAIGAVNTIFWDGDRLLGDNTDVLGYRAMLGGSAPRRALILGSGGAARAVAFALAEDGAQVTIAARLLARAVAGACEAADVAAIGWQRVDTALVATDLVVNATPVGMADGLQSPLEVAALERLPRHARVHDLVYGPHPTRLVLLARERGLDATDGQAMLIHQAAAAFWRWTGVFAPVEQMERAFRRALAV